MLGLLWLRLEFSQPGRCRGLFVLVCWFLGLGWLNGGLCRLGVSLTHGAMLQPFAGQVVVRPLGFQLQHPAVAAGGRGGVLKAIEVDVGLQQHSARIIGLLSEVLVEQLLSLSKAVLAIGLLGGVVAHQVAAAGGISFSMDASACSCQPWLKAMGGRRPGFCSCRQISVVSAALSCCWLVCCTQR